jgi:DNA-binding NarL/FixJ family response regulator
MIKLAIVDDHALFRIGLIGILQKDPAISIVGEFESFSSLKPLVEELEVDLFLIDIGLDKESGLEIVQFIKDTRPVVKVIVLSSHKTEFYVVNAVDAGIDGYIHKDASAQELLLGIRKVLNGEKFYSSEISTLLINNMYSKSYRGLPFLTNKEKQVAQYLVEGYSSKEIAGKLDVSPRTIDTHRANILGKFGLKNTAELVKNIIEQKIKL